jgi:hypothetical protein
MATLVCLPRLARNWRGAHTQGLVTTIWYPVAPTMAQSAHDIGAPGDPIFRRYPVVNNAPLSHLYRPRAPKYPFLICLNGFHCFVDGSFRVLRGRRNTETAVRNKTLSRNARVPCNRGPVNEYG